MSSFASSFGDESRLGGSTRPFDDDGYMGYDPRLASQRFDSSFSNFDADYVKVSVGDSSPIFTSQSYGSGDEVFSSNPLPDTPSPPSIFSAGGGLSSFSPEQNGKSFDVGFGASDGSTLPQPSEMPSEDGFALREWRSCFDYRVMSDMIVKLRLDMVLNNHELIYEMKSLVDLVCHSCRAYRLLDLLMCRYNAIRLEEKEKEEKEMLQKIIEEAEQYKVEFYRKRALTLENKKASNREKEKLVLVSQEKFHDEAEKNCWTAIAELIPYEVPAIEKKGTKQADQDKKKPSAVVIQGPKPGKPTDLSRMRQILVKLKHSPPPHMKPKPLPSSDPKKDAKTGPSAGGASSTATASKPAASATPESVAAA